MNNSKKSSRSRKGTKKSSKSTKTITAVVKQVMSKEVETKTLNVAQFGVVGPVNAVALNHFSLMGAQYLCEDIFSQPQGVTDSSVLGSGNRIGDRIKGVGFLMDYYFTAYNTYSILPSYFYIPFVKLRITVFRQSFGTPALPQSLIYDGNYVNANTATLQPINWNEGYVKDVLYDKVHIIRNTLSSPFGGSGTVIQNPKIGNVFHFKKYIKYDHLIKYNDNNTTSPNSTQTPVNICICAEVDDSTSLVPSSTPIMYTTGYTRCWFKDA